MPTLYSLEHVPIETLRKLAMAEPETWADVYDNEMVRRHPVYQGWLKKNGLEHSVKNLHAFRHR